MKHNLNNLFHYFMLGLLLLSPLIYADDYISPEIIEGTHVLDAEGLIGLAVNRPSAIIIDSRTHADRIAGYIDDSIHLTDTDTNCTSLAAIAPDLDAPIIFYCNGEHCDRSDKSAQIAMQCNYTNVYWFRGGMTEWLAKDYPVSRN